MVGKATPKGNGINSLWKYWEGDDMAELEKVIKGLAHCTRPSEIGKGGNFCMDCQYTEPIGFNQFKCNSQQMMKDALELLKEQRKTGKWIEQEDYNGDTYYDCSVCGESWTTIEGTPWQNGMNYCPHCGAKMELVR